MCANHEFNYALTYINDFYLETSKWLGRGGEFIVMVWEVQSISVGLWMLSHSPGVAMASSLGAG